MPRKKDLDLAQRVRQWVRWHQSQHPNIRDDAAFERHYGLPRNTLSNLEYHTPRMEKILEIASALNDWDHVPVLFGYKPEPPRNILEVPLRDVASMSLEVRAAAAQFLLGEHPSKNPNRIQSELKARSPRELRMIARHTQIPVDTLAAIASGGAVTLPLDQTVALAGELELQLSDQDWNEVAEQISTAANLDRVDLSRFHQPAEGSAPRHETNGHAAAK